MGKGEGCGGETHCVLIFKRIKAAASRSRRDLRDSVGEGEGVESRGESSFSWSSRATVPE